MPAHALVVLGRPSTDAPAQDPAAPPYRLADAAEPQLSVLDLGPTRGDGIFETISVGFGRPQSLDHHLARFARSAAMLDLPAPDLPVWREAIHACIAELHRSEQGTAELDPAAEAFVKIVMTRGIEGEDAPTGWAYAAPAPDFTAARTEGIRVVLLDRGYRHDVASTSPWLLAGAKTLSYAVNRAAGREAARRGADDALFISSDGVLLEGPTSTLIYRRGHRLLTPGPGLGILEGTTQVSLFRFAESIGMATGFELGTPDTLREADAAWLVSSVRLAAPIRELEAEPYPVDAELSAAMNGHLAALRE